MRRTDREITDRAEMLAIMEKCQVCRLALHNGDYPYILPVNFGMEEKDGQLVLYFHGAAEGTKYDLMAADPRASFEMDCETVLCSSRKQGNCTMSYSSVIGRGTVSFLEGAEKVHALDVLTAHYHPEGFAYYPAVIPQTRVWQLTVESMTAKHRRMLPPDD